MSFPYNFDPKLLKRLSLIRFKNKAKAEDVPIHVSPEYFHEMLYLDYGKIDMTICREKIVDPKNPDNPLFGFKPENPEKIILAPGECIFIHGGTPHAFRGYEGIPFDYLNVMFHGELPEDLCGRPIPVNRICHGLITALNEESLNNREYHTELSACLFMELLIRLLRQEREQTFPLPIETPHQEKFHSEVVRRALTIIDKNYNTPLRLKMLARATGVSIPYLSLLLKRETNKTFTALLQEKRIAAAKYLLREGNLSPTGIAQAVGYPSLNFFYRLFKRTTGTTPAEYSKTVGKK